MIRSIITFMLTLLFAIPASAQFYSTKYRVPDQNWMEIRTEQFRLIYPERYQSEAYHSLSILESEYEDIQALTGGELRDFPVIINPENDRSNGFVSPTNFRSEIELSPIKGKALSPRSGDWLEAVLPHELVHALHMSVDKPFLGKFSPVRLMAKDFRRSIHTSAPLGLLEGIAVQHESHGNPHLSGRGNYPYFKNQFNAMLNTDNEWSMGQLVQTSDYTLPFNRHYIGGYEFVHWLLKTHGDDAMKNAIEMHYKFPFLGFGMALKFTTGDYPGTLYREFSRERKPEEEERLTDITSSPQATEVPFMARCRQIQRPLWLDGETLVFFARSCNRPTGFYTYKTGSDNPELLKEVNIVEDYHYSLTPDRNQLLYSRYHPSPFYDNVFQGDLHRLDVYSGSSERLTKNLRLFAPDQAEEQLAALQTDSYQQKLVLLDQDTHQIDREVPKPDSSSVIQIAISPEDPNRVAVIGKIKSVQALWIAELSQTDSLFTRPPDVAFENSSIFDVAWHPSEEKTLFVSGRTGSMNVYEFDLSTQSITQITDSPYNAIEPSYSPNGEQIAYIEQIENERRLFVMGLSSGINRAIEEKLWSDHENINTALSRPLLNQSSSTEWKPELYKTGFSWLKPRVWQPVFRKENGFYQYGIDLQSVDRMSSQSYSLEFTRYIERYWYDLSYTYKGFYPGFRINLYNEPFLGFFPVQRNGESDTEQLLQQSRGGSLSIPIPIRLESNTRFTSLFFEPEYSVGQFRYLNPAQPTQSYSDFAIRHTASLYAALNLNIRQFSRDIQPNRGWVFFTDSRFGLNSDEITGGDGDFSFSGNVSRRKGFRAGISTFLAPLQSFNQSLRLTVQGVTQTDSPVFNTGSLFSDHFADIPFPGANNVGILNARYTIPVVYPDNGGFLIPAYLSNIYLVLFSQTATDLNSGDWMGSSRSVFGAGIRSRFRLSNMAFDIGFSIGWKPERNEFTYHFDTF